LQLTTTIKTIKILILNLENIFNIKVLL